MYYLAVHPPSTSIEVAVTIEDAEEAKKQTLVATSLSVAAFPIGIFPKASFLKALFLKNILVVYYLYFFVIFSGYETCFILSIYFF